MVHYHLNIIWNFLLLFMCLSLVSADGCAYRGPPDIDLFLPHNKYCNLFYRLDKCSNNLVYNTSTQQCDLPTNTKCGSRKILTTKSNQEGGTTRDGGGCEPREDDLRDPCDTNDYPILEGGYSFIGGECRSRKKCPQQSKPNERIFIPHWAYCNLFCSCVRGTPILYRCHLGLQFNPKTSRCEYPREEFEEIIFERVVGTEISSAPIYVGGECRPKGKCPRYGESRLPHETESNLLCVCKNGKPILYSCPTDLIFDATLKKCDYPNRVEIEEKELELIYTHPTPKSVTTIKGTRLGGTCFTSSMFPFDMLPGQIVFSYHMLVCNLFCAFDGNRVELYACAKGLHFNPKTQECESPSHVVCKPTPPQEVSSMISPKITGIGDCPTIQPCPLNDPTDFTIYLPHQTDCKFFCRCNHGVPKLQKCETGLHFNPKRQLCDVPNKANCETTLEVEQQDEEANNGGGAVTDGQQGYCPAEGICKSGQKDHLPHQRSCFLFCECVDGIPRLRQCPDGLHFNPNNKQCETPNKALCQGECSKLEHRDATSWYPNTCKTSLSKIGDMCRINCTKGYELRGNAVVTCTKQGWNSTAGFDIMPSCKLPEEFGNDIIDNVKQQAEGHFNFLFILDESTSLTQEEFDFEITFIKAIVGLFPLSQNRNAGVITFSNSATVDVHITHNNSCQFFQEIDKITYTGGQTNIRAALMAAFSEILSYGSKIRTLIFLITDGKSKTDPTSAANNIKTKEHVLFTIGVGDYDRQQLELLASLGNDGYPLFFGVSDFKAFNRILDHLQIVHGYGVTLNCPTSMRG